MNNNIRLLISFILLIFAKLWVGIYIFGFDLEPNMGGDSNYYHSFALGQRHDSVNLWSSFLRWMHEMHLYNRTIYSYLIFFLSCIIPFILFFFVAGYGCNKKRLTFTFVFSLYPTIYLHSFDIYRDIPMFFVFTVTLLTARRLFFNSNYKPISFFFCVVLSFVLFKMRPYLGFAFVFALFSFPFYKNFDDIKKIALLYLIFIVLIYSLGFLSPIIDYRESISMLEGGSNLGVVLPRSDLIGFLLGFLKSYLMQFFGFYIFNLSSLFAFFVEGIPIVILSFYCVKNYRKLSFFSRFLIVFVISYNTIWIIGSDNLGTAMRLRIFSVACLSLVFFELFSRNENENITHDYSK